MLHVSKPHVILLNLRNGHVALSILEVNTHIWFPRPPRVALNEHPAGEGRVRLGALEDACLVA